MSDDRKTFLETVRADVATNAFMTVLKHLRRVIKQHTDRGLMHFCVVDQRVFTPYLEHVPGTTMVRATVADNEQPDSVVLFLTADLGAARTLETTVVMPSLRRNAQLVKAIMHECARHADEWRQPGGTFDAIARHATAIVYNDVPPVTVDLLAKVAELTRASTDPDQQLELDEPRAKRPASPSTDEPVAKRRTPPPRAQTAKLDLRVQSKQPPVTHEFEFIDSDLDVRTPKVWLRNVATGERERFVPAEMWVRMGDIDRGVEMLRWLNEQHGMASVTLADATRVFDGLAKTWPVEAAKVVERCRFVPLSRAPSLLVAYHAFIKCQQQQQTA